MSGTERHRGVLLLAVLLPASRDELHPDALRAIRLASLWADGFRLWPLPRSGPPKVKELPLPAEFEFSFWPDLVFDPQGRFAPGGASASVRVEAPQLTLPNLGEGAGLVHLSVSFVNPGVMLRLTGSLGPLGLMGVAGNMTWEFFDADDGTRVKFTYAVGGYRAGGLGAISLPVDYVIGEALQRLKAHVETGDAENAVVE